MEIIKEIKWNSNWKIRQETKFLIVHHAMARIASVHDINLWHLNDNGWAGGIGYHFYIRKDGKIYEGRPINVVGAHTRGWNHHSIGICFEGDFSQEYPTIQQVNSGIELIRHVLSIYPDLEVKKHKDCNNDTECPAKFFNDKIIIEGKKKKMEKHWCDEIFEKLKQYGIKINEKRFDDNIKRSEVFALLLQVLENKK